MKLNYQVEVQDHILAQVQFQKKDNLPKMLMGFLTFEVWTSSDGCAEIESWFLE